jgi:hypothetical protein
MINDAFLQRLTELYHKTSKHSNYQTLAPALASLLNTQSFQIKSRHEEARWSYIQQHVDFLGKTIADIGGNTGFFSFRSLDEGARLVDYYEGNAAHAVFVELAAQLPQYQYLVNINSHYIDLEREQLTQMVDILLLLNVLHHIGDDYGDQIFNPEKALDHIKKVLCQLVYHTDYLVFQLGFNWKGDIKHPLFLNGTKSELIAFIKEATNGIWNIEKIGVAVKKNNVVEYRDLNKSNITRQDELGEFLNRPLFILRSAV